MIELSSDLSRNDRTDSEADAGPKEGQLSTSVRKMPSAERDLPDLSTGTDTQAFIQLDQEKVLGHLRTIKSSQFFANSKRLISLLDYIVGETISGRGNKLSEYSIAQDVFERGDEFDPRDNAIVRVEIGRLRRKLAQFYEGEGACHSFMLSIPKGAYSAKLVSMDHHGGDGERVEDETSRCRGQQGGSLGCILTCQAEFTTDPGAETNSQHCSKLACAAAAVGHLVNEKGGKLIIRHDDRLVARFCNADDAICGAIAASKVAEKQDGTGPEFDGIRLKLGLDGEPENLTSMGGSDIVSLCDSVIGNSACCRSGICLTNGFLANITDHQKTLRNVSDKDASQQLRNEPMLIADGAAAISQPAQQFRICCYAIVTVLFVILFGIIVCQMICHV